MKIIQVNTGLQPIGINSWGAVERCIYFYHQYLTQIGIECEIRYPNEIENRPNQIVHVHIANQALMLAERKIPYIFHFHDHNVCLQPKSSSIYLENLKAVENSIITLVPAEYLVSFFEKPYKTFYLPHGVDPARFPLKTEVSREHKLLVLANNGLCFDPTFDRKGFRLAIEAAKELDLPITVAGPTNNNKLFFDKNPDLLTYPKLTIQYDLTYEDLIAAYHNHSIFIHPSIIEAGQPCLTLLEALSCGLPVVGTFEGSRSLPGLKRINLNKNELIFGIKDVISDYSNYIINSQKTVSQYFYQNIINVLINIYSSVQNIKDNFTFREFQKETVAVYQKTTKINRPSILETREDEFFISFINGASVEIKGQIPKTYQVEFYDRNTSNLIYQASIQTNHWAKTNSEYFIDYDIRIKDNKGKIIDRHLFDLTNKNVLICQDSKSLGDALAWMPAIEEFQKIHNCRVFCSTFWNDLFKSEYPSINFVNPGETVGNIYAQYNIGIYTFNNKLDFAKHRTDPRSISLSNIAFDILGLPYKNISPKVFVKNSQRQLKEKYVTINTHGTANFKLWHRKDGWQNIINHLNKLGYKVVLTQKEETEFKNIIDPTDKSIENTINLILHSDFHIGTSSGPVWLASALKNSNDIILISGFTEDFNEFPCRRINAPPHVCRGCYNRLDDDNKFLFFTDKARGNWNFCPMHENTNKQFECSKSITEETIITEINKIIATKKV